MTQTIFPLLTYRDPAAAIDFLERAFGFERRAVHTDDAGSVVHAELAFRGSQIMLGRAREEMDLTAGRGGAYLVVEDADAHHDRAKTAGAEILSGLQDTDYGSRDYAARDLEGNPWFFGTYGPEDPS
jgi:uncharacterized glyoxalase superfamily protein PhnB